MSDHSELAEALLDAPVGVALLARLDPDGIGAAAVDGLSFGQLLHVALDAAWSLAGPWTPGAPAALAEAWRSAADRRAVASAVAARFGEELLAPIDPARQEWWTTASATAPAAGGAPRPFVDHDQVYGNGEFTWAGRWTVTAPPAEVHDALIAAWELFPPPVVRRRLPVRRPVRVHEVHGPDDWVELVRRYPARARGPHAGWELPGPNQHDEEIAPLLAVGGQRAVRTQVRHHLLPDWVAIARELDGVHLSWAGFLTCEGRVVDLGDGDVTMLRYWASERTLWLHDVFDPAEPLPAPGLAAG